MIGGEKIERERESLFALRSPYSTCLQKQNKKKCGSVDVVESEETWLSSAVQTAHANISKPFID